jgi:hypothetical protein
MPATTRKLVAAVSGKPADIARIWAALAEGGMQ